MAEITATMVKELRDRTGVGMGKCKEALEASNGDMELAIANLRKAGIASAVKKESREAKEGKIAIADNGKNIAIVEVNAETDFVANNEQFQKFLIDIANEIVNSKPASVDALKQQKYSKDSSLTIEEYRATFVQKVGENIQIRRFLILDKSNNKSIGVYSHLGGKLVTAVEISGSPAEEALAKDIAMHVAAAAPEYLSEKEVPSSILDNERDIAKSQVKGKPDAVIQKIVDGKIQAFYDANCLDRQEYIRDHSLRIRDLIAKQAKTSGKPLTITSFLRWSVGQ